MYNSDIQAEVSDKITNQQFSPVKAGLTESELNVVVTVGNVQAHFTAKETRLLAESIEFGIENSDWDYDEELVQYLYDLADVVDGKKERSELDNE